MAEEFTAKFKVDITDLKKNIADAAKSIKEANATFKAQTAGMDRWSDNADGLSKKLEQLDTILKNQKAILASYREELRKQKEAAKENGQRADDLRKKLQELAESGVSKTSEEYQKYKRALQNVTKEQENNEKAADDLKITILNQEAAVKSTERDIRHYTQSLDNLDAETEEVAKDTGKANEGFTVLKGTLANLAAEGIKKAISGLKKLGQAAVDAYKDFDTGSDNIIKATGATGEAAEKLQKTYKNVTQKVVGNLDDIGSTLGELNTRFGFTDEKLEDATTAFTKFADITGTDAVSAVQSVSRIMQKAGIPAENYGKLLDALTKAAQDSGISVEDLTGTMEKVGTEMSGLGLDTKETVALLASFEKSGVNSNTVLAGMRKAFQKWAKEGKNSKKEFQKVIDEIKATPSKTKAAQKAIEVFGSKAGAELADAVHKGKFEYSDFLKTLENSTGTVEKTYEATQDGFDKVRLVIQGAKTELGAYVSELAKKYSPQIETFAKKAVDAIKKAVDWVSKNGKTIAGFAGAIATAFAVKKIANFVSTLGKAAGAIKGVVGTIKGVSSAVGAIDFASLLNPIGLVVAAVGGLSAAFVVARQNIDKEIEAQYGLTEEQKKTIQAAADIKASYNDMDSARKDSMGAIDSEFGHLEDLKKEYNKLIGKNGEVKKGYENRAKFIETEFSRVLGIELEDLQKLIDKNGKLGESIDEVITKKKAEAILAANQDAYTEAYQRQNEALQIYLGNLDNLNKAEENYDKTLKETKAEREKISTAMQHASGDMSQYHYQLGLLAEKEKVAKKALNDSQKAVEDSEEAYFGYLTTIKNYEGLSEKIIGGEAKAIDSAMSDIQKSFISAETGNQKSLTRQYNNLVEEYKRMEQAARDGQAGVTRKAVDQQKIMVEKAKTELIKYQTAHKDTFNALLTEAGKASEQMTEKGSTVGHAFWSNVESPANVQGSANAGAALGNAVVSAADVTAEMEALANSAADGYNRGLSSKFDKIRATARAYVRAGIDAARAEQNSNSPSKVWEEEVGESAGEGGIVGLANMIRPAVKKAKDFVKSMLDAATGEAGKFGAGRAFGGFGQNLAGSVANAAVGLNSGALRQNGGGSSTTNVGGSSYTYNQTINSPKALSRIEIYRQTKNLLTLAKMGA